MTDTSLFSLPVGTVIGGRYQIRRVLGVGGFSITYQAYDMVLCGAVAVKEFFPQSCAERIPYQAQVLTRGGESQVRFQEGLARFKREAVRTAKLQGRHNVIDVYGLCEGNGTAYMIMEYLEGLTLAEYLSTLPAGYFQDIDDAVRIISAVAEALAYVHSHNMLHRDVSPDNIFLCANGSVRLIDFGAAREHLQTQEHSIIVKAGCTPPEQYNRNGKQGPWTDIYAMGATLYVMLTGRFPDAAPDRQGHGAAELLLPSTINSAVPEYLDVLVARCLALDHRFRISSAEEVRRILSQRLTVCSVGDMARRRRRAYAVLASVSAGLAVFLAALGVTAYMKTDNLYAAVLAPCTIYAEFPAHFTSLEGLEAVERDFENEYPMVDLRLLCQDQGTFSDTPAIFCYSGDERGCARLDELRQVLPEGDFYAQQLAYAPTLLYGNSAKAARNGASWEDLISAESIPAEAITESYTAFMDIDNHFYVYRGPLGEYTDIQQRLSGLYTVCPDPNTSLTPVALSISEGLSPEEELAAMRFLLYLSSERAQEILFLEHHGMLPMEQEAYDRFFEIYPELEFLRTQYGR